MEDETSDVESNASENSSKELDKPLNKEPSTSSCRVLNKRILMSKRPVNSIDTTLDGKTYDEMELPSGRGQQRWKTYKPSLGVKPNPEKGTGPFYIKGTENYVKSLVSRLSEDVPLQGRNISMDRLYTAISTAIWLLEHRVTCVRTIMSNRVGIPAEVNQHREEMSYHLQFTGKSQVVI